MYSIKKLGIYGGTVCFQSIHHISSAVCQSDKIEPIPVSVMLSKLHKPNKLLYSDGLTL